MPRPLALLVEAQEPGALNLCRAFREAGHDVTILHRGARPAAKDPEVLELGKPSAVVDLYPGVPRADGRLALLNGLGHKAAQGGLGPLAREVLLPAFDALLAKPVQERVARAVAESGAEVVYAYWGIGSLPEQRALQRARTPAALVQQFATYPLGKARQDRPLPASPLERATLGALDGRIHASAQMRDYLAVALRPTHGVDEVLPDAWGPWATARGRRPLLSDEDGLPHVVHVGAPPVRPGSHDDVGRDLAALARAGVAVHAVEAFGGVEGLRTFPRTGTRALLTGEFATFLTQFDALVLLYDAPPGLQWFAGNMPARFLSGVSAGIPLALPRGLFGALEDFVREHGNGFTYEGPEDLARRLRDDTLMGPARKAAEEVQRAHRFDAFVPRYQAFLERALDARTASPSRSPK